MANSTKKTSKSTPKTKAKAKNKAKDLEPVNPQRITLTDEQVEMFLCNGGLELVAEDGHTIDKVSPSMRDLATDLINGIENSKECLHFLNRMLLQSSPYIDFDSQAMFGLANILEHINNNMELEV